MIGIIGAMQLEVDEILKIADSYQKKVIFNTDFYEVNIENQKLIVVLSGIGKTNAAISTTLLLVNFDIDLIINIGTAGGLQTYEKVLDVIVATKVAFHDIEVPNWPKGFSIKDDELTTNNTVFDCDFQAVKLISELIGDNANIYKGPMVSGDQFIYKKAQCEQILQNYPEALCVDMEGAAIAKVCERLQVPFVIIRSLSDITIAPKNELTFDEYAIKAAKRSAVWAKEIVLEHNKKMSL